MTRTFASKTDTNSIGLGEISPKEFAQFIGKKMVLVQGHHVECVPRADWSCNVAQYFVDGVRFGPVKDLMVDPFQTGISHESLNMDRPRQRVRLSTPSGPLRPLWDELNRGWYSRLPGV